MRERPQKEIGIPEIMDSLKDRPLRSSRNLISKVGRRLTTRPRTAGTCMRIGQFKQATMMRTKNNIVSANDMVEA